MNIHHTPNVGQGYIGVGIKSYGRSPNFPLTSIITPTEKWEVRGLFCGSDVMS